MRPYRAVTKHVDSTPQVTTIMRRRMNTRVKTYRGVAAAGEHNMLIKNVINYTVVLLNARATN